MAGVPETITIEGRAAKEAALTRANEAPGPVMTLRQITDRNKIVEQDHRAVTRVTRPRLGCKSFDAAPSTIAGIELMHMRRNGQLDSARAGGRTATAQCHALAA